MLVIGNWKMNMCRSEAKLFLPALVRQLRSRSLQCALSDKLHMSIAPPIIYLHELISQIKNFKKELTHTTFLNNFNVTAQNASSYANGAYTGEVSASILEEYRDGNQISVLIGHSERRSYFNEKNNILLNKMMLCFNASLIPILCFGESLNDRSNGIYLKKIELQLKDTIAKVSHENISQMILAYEPIWAIGTGQNATSEQIEEVHNYVRLLLVQYFGKIDAFKISILYGGSCNDLNAQNILQTSNVDGLLVGGASLDVSKFCNIIEIANELS
jgi:triosephosphate isomerase